MESSVIVASSCCIESVSNIKNKNNKVHLQLAVVHHRQLVGKCVQSEGVVLEGLGLAN
jgi:hypothetical protein